MYNVSQKKLDISEHFISEIFIDDWYAYIVDISIGNFEVF